MNRWKSTDRKKLRQGESQKREDRRGRRSERETVRRAKMQVPEKVGKSQNNVFFQGSLKRRMRSQLASLTEDVASSKQDDFERKDRI